MNTFVGRDNPVREIHEELTDQDSERNTRILSISGPGGVGKTFLLDHVISNLDLLNLNYLTLKIDGNSNSVTLAEMIIRDLIENLPPVIAGDPQYFRVTRQGLDHLRHMDTSARAELESIAKDNNDDELAKLIGRAYDGAVGLLGILPNRKAKKISRVTKRIQGADIERIVSVARQTKAYREEKGTLFGLLPVGRVKNERNLLRKDLSGRLAEYLATDLAAILSGYQPKDWKRYLPSKVDGLDRCLMIFDDYETLEFILDDFLRHELFQRLRKREIQTVIIFLGRDSIRDVNYAWDQYFGKDIVLDLRLAPLTEDESQQYLDALGIKDLKIIERILKDSAGLPFLLAAEAEYELRGERSALSLQKFVDRTTRWMTEEQRQWVVALAFIEEVNEDTVQYMLPDSNPIEVVDWFKRESSIRSPEAGKWRMRHIIRERIQESIKNDSPSQYRSYKQQAEKALQTDN